LFPQPKIKTSSGTMLLDAITGQTWCVFYDGRAGLVPADTEAFGIPSFVLGGRHYIEKEAVASAWFDLHECSVAIVRPDHYVYCGLRDVGLIDQVCRDLQYRLTTSSPRGAPVS